MKTVQDAYEHAKWLIEHGRGGEPGELFLPKLEAQRKRENKEQRKRVIFECTPEQYGAWHEMRERYWELIPNKTVALDVMVMILGAVESETLKRMGEEAEEQE